MDRSIRTPRGRNRVTLLEYWIRSKSITPDMRKSPAYFHRVLLERCKPPLLSGQDHAIPLLLYEQRDYVCSPRNASQIANKSQKHMYCSEVIDFYTRRPIPNEPGIKLVDEATHMAEWIVSEGLQWVAAKVVTGTCMITKQPTMGRFVYIIVYYTPMIAMQNDTSLATTWRSLMMKQLNDFDDLHKRAEAGLQMGSYVVLCCISRESDYTVFQDVRKEGHNTSKTQHQYHVTRVYKQLTLSSATPCSSQGLLLASKFLSLVQWVINEERMDLIAVVPRDAPENPPHAYLALTSPHQLLENNPSDSVCQEE